MNSFQSSATGTPLRTDDSSMRQFHFGIARNREDRFPTATISAWAASRGPVDTRWHAVGRAGGGALAAECGTYVYGPVHLRRSARIPDGVADRAMCQACARRVS